MKKNNLALYSLHIENIQALLMESEASDMAKQLGLVHKGWGYWADPAQGGLTVAKTIKGKLVKLSGQEFDAANYKTKKKDAAKADIEIGDLALTKATNALVDYAGLDIDDSDPEYQELKRTIIKVAENPNMGHNAMYDAAEQAIPNASESQQQLAWKYLKHLANTPESPIMQALAGYKAAHQTMSEPDDEDEIKPISLNLKTAKEAIDIFKSSIDGFLPVLQMIKFLRDPSNEYAEKMQELLLKYNVTAPFAKEMFAQLAAIKQTLLQKAQELGDGQFDPSPFVQPFASTQAPEPVEHSVAYEIAQKYIPNFDAYTHLDQQEIEGYIAAKMKNPNMSIYDKLLDMGIDNTTTAKIVTATLKALEKPSTPVTDQTSQDAKDILASVFKSSPDVIIPLPDKQILLSLIYQKLKHFHSFNFGDALNKADLKYYIQGYKFPHPLANAFESPLLLSIKDKYFSQHNQIEHSEEAEDIVEKAIHPGTWADLSQTQHDAILNAIDAKLQNPDLPIVDKLTAAGLKSSLAQVIVSNIMSVASKKSQPSIDADHPVNVPEPAFETPPQSTTPVTPQQSQEVLDILDKISKAKYAQEIHNLKKKAFAAGVTEEQWKDLLGYLKSHLAAYHNNPYYKAKKKKKINVQTFDPQGALKAMGMDQSQQQAPDDTPSYLLNTIPWNDYPSSSYLTPQAALLGKIQPNINFKEANEINNTLGSALAAGDKPAIDTALKDVKKWFTLEQFEKLKSGMDKLLVQQKLKDFPESLYTSRDDLVAKEATSPVFKLLAGQTNLDVAQEGTFAHLKAFTYANKAIDATTSDDFNKYLTKLSAMYSPEEWANISKGLFKLSKLFGANKTQPETSEPVNTTPYTSFDDLQAKEEGGPIWKAIGGYSNAKADEGDISHFNVFDLAHKAVDAATDEDAEAYLDQLKPYFYSSEWEKAKQKLLNLRNKKNPTQAPTPTSDIPHHGGSYWTSVKDVIDNEKGSPLWNILANVQLKGTNPNKIPDAFNLANQAIAATSEYDFSKYMSKLSDYIENPETWKSVSDGINKLRQEKQLHTPDKAEQEFNAQQASSLAADLLADLSVMGVLPKHLDAQHLLKVGAPFIAKAFMGPANMVKSHVMDFAKEVGGLTVTEFNDVVDAVMKMREKSNGEEPSTKLSSLIPSTKQEPSFKVPSPEVMDTVSDLLKNTIIGEVPYSTKLQIGNLFDKAVSAPTSDEVTDIIAGMAYVLKLPTYSSAITALTDAVFNAKNQKKTVSEPEYSAPKIEQDKLENYISDLIGPEKLDALDYVTTDKIQKALAIGLNTDSTPEAWGEFTKIAKLLNINPHLLEGSKLFTAFVQGRKALGKSWDDSFVPDVEPNDTSNFKSAIETSVEVENLAQQAMTNLETKWSSHLSDTTFTMMQQAISKAIAAKDVDEMMEHVETAVGYLNNLSSNSKFDDIMDAVKAARKELHQTEPAGDQSLGTAMIEPNALKYPPELQKHAKFLNFAKDLKIDPDQAPKVGLSLNQIDTLMPSQLSVPVMANVLINHGLDKAIALNVAKKYFQFKQHQLASGELDQETGEESEEEPQIPDLPNTPSEGGAVKQALDKIDIPMPHIKAINTSMQKDWSAGDPKKVANWIINAWKKEKPFATKNKQAWADKLLALAKYYDYDLSNAPKEMLPPEIQQALLAPAAPSVVGTAYPADQIEKSVAHYLNKSGGDANDALASVESIIDITDNPHKKELYKAVAKELEKKAQEQQSSLLQPKAKEPTKEIDPEIEKQHKEESAAEAKDFLTGYLNTVGVELNKLPKDAQLALQKATDEALDSQSEFGVIWPFHNIKNVDDTILDGLKETILDKLSKEGTLDSSPDAFKKHFNYQGFLDDFLQQNPAFAQNLSQEDKATLLQAMKVGLNKPSYQDAKAYYNQTLVGKIPGFDETIFQKWRNQLMQMFDEMKNAQAYEHQKKLEKEQKKKEAEAMQKALEQLSKGGLKDKLDAIATAAGVPSSDAHAMNAFKLQVANALKSSNSEEALTAINNIATMNKKLVDSLVLSTWFDNKYNLTPKIAPVEPKTTEPVELRAKHAFQAYFKATGATIGHIPSSNSERSNMINAVTNALQMADGKAMPSWLAGQLASSTSLTDDQIAALVKAVQQERTNPVSLSAGSKPSYVTPTYTAEPTKGVTSSPAPQSKTSLWNNLQFKKYMNYYGVSPSNTEAVAAIANTLAAQGIWKGNRPSYVNKLRAQLENAGIDPGKAKNIANWATREAMEASELAKHAFVQTQSTSSTKSSTGVPYGDDQTQIKNYVASLNNIQDKHGLARGILAKGETLKLAPNVKYSTPSKDGQYSNADATAQAQWLQSHLTPQMHAAWMHARGGWQSSSQWGKNWKARKFTNQVVTQVIEGPPPLYAKMPPTDYLERGMLVSATDFKEYIKAFEVGKKSFIGPSGFSSNTTTPRMYAHPGNSDPDFVSVLMRVRPDKSGKLKGARLQNYGFGAEHEIIVGTGNNYRCSNVVKHLMPTSGGKVVVAYEIELQYEDDTNESIVGFPTNYWKGLSRDTIKMLLKYNNSSVHNVPGAN